MASLEIRELCHSGKQVVGSEGLYQEVSFKELRSIQEKVSVTKDAIPTATIEEALLRGGSKGKQPQKSAVNP